MPFNVVVFGGGVAPQDVSYLRMIATLGSPLPLGAVVTFHLTGTAKIVSEISWLGLFAVLVASISAANPEVTIIRVLDRPGPLEGHSRP